MADSMIGVIGGSGLYDMEGLSDVKAVRVDTPFGDPSDEYITGVLAGKSIAFLPRHGKGHRITPSELNFRANIYGFKKLGASRIISVGAVGSMKEELAPTHIVVPDQFIDRTYRRGINTFFGNGVVGHVSLADPFCRDLSGTLYQSGRKVGVVMHKGGTYICIEGPQFSTRAESHLFRSWGVDIIGMTNVTEARLAREAEICYATLALVTDYDCWKEEEEAVTVDAIIAILKKNAANAEKIVCDAIANIPTERNCTCATALASALVTDPSSIPDKTKQDLDIIIGKYLS